MGSEHPVRGLEAGRRWLLHVLAVVLFAIFVGQGHARVVLLLHEDTLTGAPISLHVIGSELVAAGEEVVVWCGHGNRLSERWRQLGKTYKGQLNAVVRDDDVIVANTAATAIVRGLTGLSEQQLARTLWIVREPPVYCTRKVRELMALVDLVVFVSEHTRAEWAECGGQSITIPNWVDLEHVDRMLEDAAVSAELPIAPFPVKHWAQAPGSAIVQHEGSHVEGGTERGDDDDNATEDSSSDSEGDGNARSKRDDGDVLRTKGTDTFVVLQVGTFCERKEQLMLAEAMVEWKNNSTIPGYGSDVHVVFVGGEAARSYTQRVRKSLESLSPEQWTLQTSETDHIYQYYARADVLVLCSALESLPRVIMEAMACGVPVITTAVSGAVELVQHGHSGIVIPAVGQLPTLERRQRAVIALAMALSRMKIDREQRTAFSVAARQRIEHNFSRQSVWPRLYAEIQRIQYGGDHNPLSRMDEELA